MLCAFYLCTTPHIHCVALSDVHVLLLLLLFFLIVVACLYWCIDVALFSVPNRPSSLTQKSIGATYIEVQWAVPTGGKDSYELRYKKASDASYQSRRVGKELTAYQIDGLNAGKTYDIGIRTISGTEESYYTDTRIATGTSTLKVNSFLCSS